MLLRRPNIVPAPPPSEIAAADLAPTFPELNEREALFVAHYAMSSGAPCTGANAALAAGYSNGNRDAAHSMASRLLRRPAVLRAIKEELGRRITSSAVAGVATLEQLAQSARSEQVRLAAANSLIDRGYGPVMSRSANTNVNLNGGIESLLKKAKEAHMAGLITLDPAAIENPD